MKQKLIVLLLAVAAISANNGPINLQINIQIGGGFFAELHKVIQTIIHYEPRGFTNIDINWRDEFFPYKDSATGNGWDLFFEPITVGCDTQDSAPEKIIISSTADFHEMHDQVCTAPWTAYEKFLPYRQFVHEKIQKYAKLKPSITKQVDEFDQTYFQNKTVIGVHARIAHVHSWLVPGKRLPTLHDYFLQVDKLIDRLEKSGKKIVVFVASDSHQAINDFNKRYGDKVTYIQAFRSQKNEDPCTLYTRGEYLMANKNVWHEEKHGTFGGITTLLDCLLLSRCDYLIHTTSNLAFFATYFNPEIKSIYLPEGVPYKTCRYKNDPTIVNKALNPDVRKS